MKDTKTIVQLHRHHCGQNSSRTREEKKKKKAEKKKEQKYGQKPD